MISRLSISNYALIDESEIDFTEGFTVITGETGAGKSIMLDALSLLKGARADSKAMGNKERKTVVEAVFSSPDKALEQICIANDIEWDPEEIIIRREITPAGKSRGFINDTPVNLGVMSEVSERLVDIHSQHSNSLLSKAAEQLAIIDVYGNTGETLKEYRETFRKYVALRNRIKLIKESISKGRENMEFIKFRLEQLDKIKPKSGELESLEREAEILGDADRIKSELTEAYKLIDGSSNSAIKQLQAAASLIENIDFDLLDPSGEDNIGERLSDLKIELRDIADTLNGLGERIESDPAKLEKTQSRIELLYETMKRFKVKDEPELIELHENLKSELAAITGENTDVSTMDKELKELAKKLKEKAEKLTSLREAAASKFADTIKEKIIPLGLPNARFEVVNQTGKLSADGQDNISFYCSFNKNNELQPVDKIASGGEISRLMLGIKSEMAEKMSLPTVIFDEIDTGVSGEIAHRMGEMMKEMAKGLQVISVTHLPQVAALGDSHLKVFKEDKDDKTVSHIKSLTIEDREKEIAGMLSGDRINEVALANARLLLKK